MPFREEEEVPSNSFILIAPPASPPLSPLVPLPAPPRFRLFPLYFLSPSLPLSHPPSATPHLPTYLLSISHPPTSPPLLPFSNHSPLPPRLPYPPNIKFSFPPPRSSSPLLSHHLLVHFLAPLAPHTYSLPFLLIYRPFHTLPSSLSFSTRFLQPLLQRLPSLLIPRFFLPLTSSLRCLLLVSLSRIMYPLLLLPPHSLPPHAIPLYLLLSSSCSPSPPPPYTFPFFCLSPSLSLSPYHPGLWLLLPE